MLTTLPPHSSDVALCMSVIEYLWEPQSTLTEVRRLLRSGVVYPINVPCWAGKRFLEYPAFTLGYSPAEEVEDHKMCYGPRDLWPLLVQAGFRPSRIHVLKHKFRLNTSAVCRADEESWNREL
ncbi:methyltransferase domain-containing protein [Mycobacterium seoulense]|uniref:methyltransferase domain-containing protein n=1 Tax=Mycobacterium seoulense TaxID=386911 RepID=UPI003CF5B166